jgi:HEPN domain-containing protein
MALRDHHGRTDLRRAALKRLNDAKALLELGKAHSRAAGYLGGYAIECLLKASAMIIFNCWTLEELARVWNVDEREVYTHGLLVLFKRIPQFTQFQRAPEWRRDFLPYLSRWRVSWRYNPHDWPLKEAEPFLAAVQNIYRWIESNC